MGLFIKSAGVSALRGVETPGERNHAARADHRHSVLGIEQLLFSLSGANMNSVADQELDKEWEFGDYLITEIRVSNPSISLTTANGGVYTAAAKGGIAVAAAQALAALNATNKGLDLTLAAEAKAKIVADSLFLTLTTAQGAAATADIYVFGIPLTEG